MKKIIIISVILLSGFTFAQESSDNPYVYDNESPELYEEEITPANPGDPKSVPIDEYIPALVIVAVSFIAYANKKKAP
ncbi:hypothetical protein AB670_01512 [Chryseobacterium sp. MOF25P]|uniref:hypothetical protein n=1 Tax=Chryseobacterium sp. BGARF1 TaxID=1664319 RepID=UPI000804A063|nr:hypothetical protein [Chryseobacterium sp. BGARF1]OBW42092.1 hypothetical protein AB670_01512 [Chryseobacterium sp. MOF25P]OBW45457.1 hypothetical protein AB671_02417 [Chryseobacterium sp. BGARF1]